MPATQSQHYIQRAKDFLEGVQVLRDDPSYRYSTAMLAIHSAISYTDALRVSLGDSELAAENHKKAAVSLQRLLSEKKLRDQTGLTHLNYLISQKSAVAYGDERLPEGVLDKIITGAQRFAGWANRTGNELKLKGWQP